MTTSLIDAVLNFPRSEMGNVVFFEEENVPARVSLRKFNL